MFLALRAIRRKNDLKANTKWNEEITHPMGRDADLIPSTTWAHVATTNSLF